ncbi:hypothetical protein Ancab_027661, partial [Ancistrocladus abbreviatus]
TPSYPFEPKVEGLQAFELKLDGGIDAVESTRHDVGEQDDVVGDQGSPPIAVVAVFWG